MFIDFHEFTKNTEQVVREVCSFVGADPVLYNHAPQPPGMKVSLALHLCAVPSTCSRASSLLGSQTALCFQLKDMLLQKSELLVHAAACVHQLLHSYCMAP